MKFEGNPVGVKSSIKKNKFFNYTVNSLAFIAFAYLSWVGFSMWYTNQIANQETLNYKERVLESGSTLEKLKKNSENLIAGEENPTSTKVLMEFTPYFSNFDLDFINSEFKKNEETKLIEERNRLLESQQESTAEAIQKQQEKLKQDYDKMIKERNEEWYQNPDTQFLDIPKISLRIGIHTDKDIQDLSVVNERLKKGVYLYPGGVPGDQGISFIFGHSSQVYSKDFYSYFKRLEEIREGDEYTIETKDYIYEYKVFGWDYLYPYELPEKDYKKIFGNRKVLTLITCAPLGTSKMRYLVYAELQGKYKK